MPRKRMKIEELKSIVGYMHLLFKVESAVDMLSQAFILFFGLDHRFGQSRFVIPECFYRESSYVLYPNIDSG